MSHDEANEMVKTTSRFWVWWLITFGGYQVKISRRFPRAGLFGRITYDIQWTLSQRSSAE